MSERAPRHTDRTATDLLEEAVALLRRTPGSVVVSYFIGAVPFWLGMLYFVADMGRSAFAAGRLLEASLGVGLLFLWMKCWQTVYASHLRATLLGEAPSPWTAGRIARLVAAQAFWQATGLFLRPIAAQIILPAVWVSSFYQNVTVLGDGGAGENGALFRRAWGQAKRWPAQAHVAVGLLSLFGFFIWANVFIAMAATPQLMKSLLGIETAASRSTGALMNTTFFSASIALTFLCLDPIWKAVYVLRCFYGEAVSSGADLQMQLRGFTTRPGGKATLVALFCALLCGSVTPPLRAESAPLSPPAGAVNPAALDRSIDDVLGQRDYAWRMPRAEEPAQAKGPFAAWLEGIANTLWKWICAVRDAGSRLVAWIIEKLFGTGFREATGNDGTLPIRALAIGLLAVGVLALAWAVWRTWGGPRRKAATAEAVPVMPDLRSEDVAADQLPEEGWLQLARELMERGELRLALRAAYLAGLAHLGQRELVSIARHKSNRDYDRELHRRARSRAELLAAFEENLLTFERAWYGCHEVTRDTFASFTRNLDRMRAC